jgi:hypothetical protein
MMLMQGQTFFLVNLVLLNDKTTFAGDFMTTESRQYASELDLIGKLEKEMDRITQAQKVMRTANRALRTGNDALLRELKFSGEHIAELKRCADSGLDGFPPCVFRNNKNLIAYIKRTIDHINNQMNFGLTSNGGERRSVEPVGAKFDVSQA